MATNVDSVTNRLRGWLYRRLMAFAHRHNWHYAPPVYPDDDVQLWCRWCGFRESKPYRRQHFLMWPGVNIGVGLPSDATEGR